MSFADYLLSGPSHLLRFLHAELAPYPGRFNSVLRCLLASGLIIVTSMALEVPWLALSLIVVFYVTQSNVVITRLVGTMFLLGSTLAIGSVILLLKFTFDYPLLRIVTACVLFFGSVYMMRITKLGVVFFLIAIVIIYVQSFVDQTDNAELLLRLALWVWVAVNYATALTLLINTLFLPAEPQLQLKAEIHRQLQAIDARLAYLLDGAGAPSLIGLPAVERGALALQKLLKFAMMRDARYRAEQIRKLAYIATVSRLYYAASELPLTLTSAVSEQVNALSDLRKACTALDSAVTLDQAFLLPVQIESGRGGIGIAPIQEMQNALQALADMETSPSPPQVPTVKESLIAEDAFSNPVYIQFSLKTLLAVLVSYVFYNAADWQGVHTIMLTCLIVASPSLGASAQKGMLRIGGALIGSALALFMVVFVIPHLDDVVGVLLMALPVIALGAWVSAGSERISYAGIQIMFTFALALLEQFGPTTDLTEIRDRMIGILLGVAVSTLVHASIWPEGEGNLLRRSLADLLRAIGKLLQPVHKYVAPTPPVPPGKQQLKVWAKLEQCKMLLSRVALEPSWEQSEHERLTLKAQTVLTQAREIMLAANALQSEMTTQLDHLPVEVRDGIFSIQEQTVITLDRYASDLVGNSCRRPPPISLSALELSFASYVNAAPEKRDFTLFHLVDKIVRLLCSLPSWGGRVNTLASFRESYNHD
ncbi:MAG TPA: FUSC family protein [Burkholderiales bacterium]|nr:FUSC family protein [Burkholderiales bacterium]